MAVRSVATQGRLVMCTYFYRANWTTVRGRIPYMDGYNRDMTWELPQYHITRQIRVSAFRIGVAPRNALALNSPPLIPLAPGRTLTWSVGIYRDHPPGTKYVSMMPTIGSLAPLNGEQLAMQVYASMSHRPDSQSTRPEQLTNKLMTYLEYVVCDTQP